MTTRSNSPFCSIFKKTLLVVLLALCTGYSGFAQLKVGDNPRVLDPSAVLELESFQQGFLPPRMTTLQRDSILLPAKGLLIYNTSSNQIEVNGGTPEAPSWRSGALPGGQAAGNMLYWDGSTWVYLPPGLPGQRLALSAQGTPTWIGPALPEVRTEAVAQIGQTTGRLTGLVASSGGAPVTARGFIWGLDSLHNGNTLPSGTGEGTFQAALSGLTPNTLYYVRAYAVNSAGTAYGSAYPLQTLPIAVPTISTATPGSITPTSAVCGGAVTDEGGSVVTARGICWSTQPNPDIQSNRMDAGTGAGAYTVPISGLTPNTLYYVRAFAINSAGVAYGTTLSFTTQNLGIPILTTYEPSNITHQNATCGGSISSDNGSPITARGVCWSLSPNPTVADFTAQNGTGTGAYSSFLPGLNPNTTYYVRAFATNAIGTAYGAQRSFTTTSESPNLPTLHTLEPTGIGRYEATVRGTLVQAGSSPVTSRGFCWNTTGNPTLAGTYTITPVADTFSLVLQNLKGGQTYYVRAFASNSNGVAYGEERTFTALTSTPLCATTVDIADVYPTYAQAGGTVSDDGGYPVLERGFVWARHAAPEVGADSSVQVAGTTGALSARLQPLTPEMTYYVRAYARNSQGIGYGNVVSFTTTPVVTSVVDIDGNEYPVVQIGTQIWMAENLRTTRYQDGTSIPYVLSDTDWKNTTSGAWCYYNHDATLNIPFGKLYNGYVAADSRNVCPSGWKIPGESDWDTLSEYKLQFSYDEADAAALKAIGNDYWAETYCSPSNNLTGFNAVGSGIRYSHSLFYGFKILTAYWGNYSSNSIFGSLNHLYMPVIQYCRFGVHIDYRIYSPPSSGLSIRCIKN